MNYTDIITTVIGLFVLIVGGLVSKYVIPWLKAKNLYEAAVVAVNAAEALYGRYHGEEKLAAALESLKQHGYDINSASVIEAVRAAWKALDISMYEAGEKIAVTDPNG